MADLKICNYPHIILFITILLALIFWVVETCFHTFIFKDGSFISQLFPTDPNELWMRSFIAILILFLGLICYLLHKKLFTELKANIIYKQIITSMHESILITDQHNKIKYVNPAYCKTTGYKPSEILGNDPNVLSSGKHDNLFYQNLWQNVKTYGYWQGEIWNRKKSGELFPEWISISTIKDKQGKTLYHTGIFTDISERKQEEEKIRDYAFYDPLTKLMNRRYFTELANNRIELAKRNKHNVAIAYLDLDYFKPINDNYGHVVGDEFLCGFAKFLNKHLRKVDIISRFGGDEFVILLDNVKDKANVKFIIETLLNKFEHDSQNKPKHEAVRLQSLVMEKQLWVLDR